MILVLSILLTILIDSQLAYIIMYHRICRVVSEIQHFEKNGTMKVNFPWWKNLNPFMVAFCWVSVFEFHMQFFLDPTKGP